MRLTRTVLGMAALFAVAGLAYVAQENRPAGSDMVAAAESFLGTLLPEQKKQASFDYQAMERTNWNFVPLQDKERRATRKGVPLEDLSPPQRKAALALLKASTSDTGNVAAVTIMGLEEILKAQEKKGAMVRNPDWYFFSIFGQPSKTGTWGWRVEGHHLSLNFALDGTQIVSATPSFYGANPAEVKAGQRKGERVLAASEDPARELYRSLDDTQKKAAYRDKPFEEPEQKSVRFGGGPPAGLPAGQMTEAQKQVLWKLLTSYTSRMPEPIGAAELEGVRKAGIDKVHFAYHGGLELGEKRSYRVQGPTFVIEFKNDQNDSGGNPANHIHCVWRHLPSDFGIKN
jgi:hypothetical protein